MANDSQARNAAIESLSYIAVLIRRFAEVRSFT